jgi:hypothetical protein
MQLDYIDNFNEYGESIIRLYDFKSSEAIKFQQAIQHTVISKKMQLELTTLDFIQSRNCNLTLLISVEDTGIISSDNTHFFCNMTIKGYEQMVLLLEPFCKKETKGFQWLYDIDTPTDFLFSPSGTW